MHHKGITHCTTTNSCSNFAYTTIHIHVALVANKHIQYRISAHGHLKIIGHHLPKPYHHLPKPYHHHHKLQYTYTVWVSLAGHLGGNGGDSEDKRRCRNLFKQPHHLDVVLNHSRPVRLPNLPPADDVLVASGDLVEQQLSRVIWECEVREMQLSFSAHSRLYSAAGCTVAA